MPVNWGDVPGVSDYRVGFGLPCERKFGPVFVGTGLKQDCCTYNQPEKHGHVHLWTGEGVGRFLFCCFSQEGVKRQTQHLLKQGYVNEAAVHVLLNLPEVLELPAALTEVEKRVLRSPKKWKRDMDFIVRKL